ncbi:hypothetical protein [Streptomyces sp. NPDC046182]|uniref:hypothetical protein n=1 Tax=Streptomyces sp. NPDC046182 TaxID=3154601 RepID=UPI0033DEB145
MDSLTIDQVFHGMDSVEAGRAREQLMLLRRAETEDEATDAVHALHEIVCYSAVTVEEETVPTVQALYLLLAVEGFRWRQFVLQLLETIICVDGVARGESSLKARVRAAVMAGVPLVEAMSFDQDRDVKGAAILLLAQTSSDRLADFRRFSSAFAEERDPVLKADLAHAAAVCAWDDDRSVGVAVATDWSKRALGDANPAVGFRVGQYLLERGIELEGVNVQEIVDSSLPRVLARRLFRMEYM